MSQNCLNQDFIIFRMKKILYSFFIFLILLIFDSDIDLSGKQYILWFSVKNFISNLK